MLPSGQTLEIEHEADLMVRDGYNPWIEQMIMQSLTDKQIVVDAGCGDMSLDDPCVVRMDVKLTPYVDIVGDLHAMPFKPSSLDFVFALAVFEHLRQPFTAAQEIWNVLKPGGYVYAECNFLFAYHGYPHHYFNASLHGLQQLFTSFRELRVGIAPYQAPSFALKNILSTYVDLFKATNFLELMFALAVQSLLQFPLRQFDARFSRNTAFRIAAGGYYVGIKQPNGDETIIPPVILDAHFTSSQLQERYPDPYDLACPDNLMTWARTEGRDQHPDIARFFAELHPFSKHITPSQSMKREITYHPDLPHPNQQHHFEEKETLLKTWFKVVRLIFRKPIDKVRDLGPLGFTKAIWRYLRPIRDSE
jgi:SAM-dependent methyltransferase